MYSINCNTEDTTNNAQYLRLILTSRVYDVVEETPLTHAVNLSNRLECKVLLKREDLQPVFSFKLRGAYNKMAHLTPQERWKGVVACSAGMFYRSLLSIDVTPLVDKIQKIAAMRH
jgi:threonine dehydratase